MFYASVTVLITLENEDSLRGFRTDVCGDTYIYHHRNTRNKTFSILTFGIWQTCLHGYTQCHLGPLHLKRGILSYSFKTDVQHDTSIDHRCPSRSCLHSYRMHNISSWWLFCGFMSLPCRACTAVWLNADLCLLSALPIVYCWNTSLSRAWLKIGIKPAIIFSSGQESCST